MARHLLVACLRPRGGVHRLDENLLPLTTVSPPFGLYENMKLSAVRSTSIY